MIEVNVKPSRDWLIGVVVLALGIFLSMLLHSLFI